MLMVGEVPTELRALPRFRSELQLDKLFDGFWASVRGVVSQIYVEFIT